MRGRASSIALGLTALLFGCTVDRFVGLPQLATDAGTQICDGTCTCPVDQSCNFLCGAQSCTSGCTALEECSGGCDGGVCGFHCEGTGTCNPGCSQGPCRIECRTISERLDCQVICSPAQECTVGCGGGSCTVLCGSLHPAMGCDAGVYTCAASCP